MQRIALGLGFAMTMMAALKPAQGGALVRDAVSACTSTGGPKLHVLIAGADSYSRSPLKGAVNDAKYLADAFCAIGGDVHVLLNGAVTRDAILQGFDALVARAKPGDWVILSYAGHGQQYPERVQRNEVDGLDEVFVLPAFTPTAPLNYQRIVDDDFQAIFAKVPAKVNVLFIADSCHSGTMTRGWDDPDKPAVRLSNYGPIANDTLPAPTSAGAERTEIANVVFASAALESEVTPEIKINGVWHGALSVAVANAARGQADLNRDGRTSLAEFRSFVVSAARSESEGRQTPDVRFASGREAEILPFGHSPVAVSPTVEPNVLMWVKGGSGNAELAGIPGIAAAASREVATFEWDKTQGIVLSLRLGDVVATEIRSNADVEGVAAKWRALGLLKPMAISGLMQLDLHDRTRSKGKGARYRAGETVFADLTIQSAARLKYITVVNLAGDGTAQFLYPKFKGEEGPWSGAPFEPRGIPIVPPFGADHLVVVASEEEPRELRQKMLLWDGKRTALEVARGIARSVKGTRHAVAIEGLYSAP